MSKASLVKFIREKYKDEGHVSSGGQSLEVHDKNDGSLLMSVAIDAHGGYVCKKEEYEARDYFSMDASKSGKDAK